jgi:hypothetical protein
MTAAKNPSRFDPMPVSAPIHLAKIAALEATLSS